jgi:hypothetical protein
MLRMTLDLHPQGAPGAQRLATLEVHNVSGPGRISDDYAWRLTHHDGRVETGYLLDRRERDATALVAAVLDPEGRRTVPHDHHGVARAPEGCPARPADYWHAYDTQGPVEAW